MVGEAVLQWIWSGLVERDETPGGSQFVGSLREVLHVPVVGFVCGMLTQSPIVVPESQEIEPGVTLADALHEELDIFVAEGSLVVFEPVGGDPEKISAPYKASRQVDRVLADLATEGYGIKSAGRGNVVRKVSHEQLVGELSASKTGGGATQMIEFRQRGHFLI